MSSSIDTGQSADTTTTNTTTSGGNQGDTEAGSSLGNDSSSTELRTSCSTTGSSKVPLHSGALETIDERTTNLQLNPRHSVESPHNPHHTHYYPNKNEQTMYPAGTSNYFDQSHHRHSLANEKPPQLDRKESSASDDVDSNEHDGHPSFSHPPWAHLKHPMSVSSSRQHHHHHHHHHHDRHSHPHHHQSHGASLKGKARATDDCDSLEDASLRPSVSATLPPDTSDDEDEDDDSEGDESDCEASSPDERPRKRPSGQFLSPSRRDPLIRIRRVGALGISVSSGDSERDDSAGEMKQDDQSGSSDERNKSTSGEGNGMTGESSDLDSAGELLARKGQAGNKSQRQSKPVLDEEFRNIVDELAVENQALRARLRRYEAARVPTNLKRDRLFEIRYFDGLSEDKRDDLETFLTRYVQGISQLHTTPVAHAPPRPARSAIEPPSSASSALTTSSQRAQAIHSVHPVADMSFSDLPPPTIPDRRVHRSRKTHALERDHLAGPSDFGYEPPSMTGTGAGIKVDSSSDDPDKKKRKKDRKKNKRRKTKTAGTGGDAQISGNAEEVSAETSAETTTTPPTGDEPENSTRGPQNLPLIDPKSIPLAQAIVGAIEKLFEDAFQARRERIAGSRTNEEFLGQLLEKDDLSHGWIYLNLVCTMAMTHRFSVTQAFIQLALRALSRRLELSNNGTKLRWIGPDLMGSSMEKKPIVAATGPSTRPSAPGYIDRPNALKHRRPSSVTQSGSDVTSSASNGGVDYEKSWNGTASGTGLSYSTAATSIQPSNSTQHLKSAVSQIGISKSYAPTTAALHRHDATPPTKRPRIEPLGVTTEMRLAAAPAKAATSISDGSRQAFADSVQVAPSEVSGSVSKLQPYMSFFARRKHPPSLARSRSNSVRGGGSSISGETGHGIVAKEPSKLAKDQAAMEVDEDEDAVDEEPGLTGSMLFYAGTRFYSDLSKETPVGVLVTDEKDPMPLGASYESRLMRSPSPEGSAILGKSVRLLLPMDVDEDDDDFRLETEALSSRKDVVTADNLGGLVSMKDFQLSGMTEAVPADAFTILVTTRLDTGSVPLEERSRARRDVSSILETKTLHGEPSKFVRPPLNKELSHLSTTSSSNNSDDSYDNINPNYYYQQEQIMNQASGLSLTTSANHHTPFVRSLAHAPSPDYLASLNLPVYTWSPHAPSSRFHWSQRAQSKASELLNQDTNLRKGSGAVTSTLTTTSEEDVKEIDLDESVKGLSRAGDSGGSH